ncbi:phosphatidylinositol polyphosphate 5-phosphatase type IV isoform X1 [Nerophis lumbriciformis]|uniref:phosphatidylinositol polyphosphate 5-phosphatase type IV isoform X1 n=1 Tax=Nerophis lumbriciformis TaxID=546530 RepID=UPI002ADF400E|nr:phosphatidylinositol polyphosphate 5-phosphatase type IV isoform X1 [Nerophis lumbriciformis]
MTENGVDSGLSQSCNGSETLVGDSRAPKTPLVDNKLCKDFNDTIKLQQAARNAAGDSPYQPRPPSLPRTRKGRTPEDSIRTRRLRSSQESLSDPVGSSTDSLKEDATVSPTGGFALGPASPLKSDPTVGLASTPVPVVFRKRGSSLSEYEHGPVRQQQQQQDSPELRLRSARMRLSPLQPTGSLPPLHQNLVSTAMRTANRIDKDCVDYGTRSVQRLHRNLSESRLLDDALSDSVSVNSMRSTSSVLSPIKPQDVRNRSFLEGGGLGSGALLGVEELTRYFPDRRLGLYIVTWNMQGEKVRGGPGKGLPSNLDDLLLPADSDFVQDFYIIGVQEGCPDRREWDTRLQETLGPHYVMLHAASHGVLYLTAFIRRDLIWFCSEVEHATVTTRIISQIKTKGAVGVALTFFGTSFLFITSHFTSGDAKVYERILDYNKIVEALSLPKGLPDTNPYRSTSSDVTTRFDQVFWFGDFNFRLGHDRAGVESIIECAAGGDMAALLEHDQLAKEMKDGSIFKGFQEARIHFLPTYKFDIGTDVYDTTTKQRTPSYTDRILFRTRYVDDIHVLKYTSCSSIKTSDHRPVVGVFHVKLKAGRDTIPLGAGQFDRVLYLEGIKRRSTRELKMREAMKNQSSVCAIS